MLSRLDLSELIQSIPQNFLPSKSYIHIHSSKISEFVLEGKVPSETLQKFALLFYIGYYKFTKIQSCSLHFALVLIFSPNECPGLVLNMANFELFLRNFSF